MDKKYVFVRDGVPEEVNAERWVWGVVYKDNTELHQFGDDGIFHQFKEIKQDEVKLFSMYRLDDMSKRHDLVKTDGMQIFHFYVNIGDLNNPEYKKKIYAFGFKDTTRFTHVEKKGEDGVWETVKSFATSHTFILPDDRTIISAEHNIDFTLFNI